MLVELFEIRPNLVEKPKSIKAIVGRRNQDCRGAEEGRKQSIVSMVNLSYTVLYKI
jgi:hypothetical protein